MWTSPCVSQVLEKQLLDHLPCDLPSSQISTPPRSEAVREPRLSSFTVTCNMGRWPPVRWDQQITKGHSCLIARLGHTQWFNTIQLSMLTDQCSFRKDSVNKIYSSNYIMFTNKPTLPVLNLPLSNGQFFRPVLMLRSYFRSVSSSNCSRIYCHFLLSVSSSFWAGILINTL